MTKSLNMKPHEVRVTGETGSKSDCFISLAKHNGLYALWDGKGVSVIAESLDKSSLKRWAKRHGYEVIEDEIEE